MNTTITPVKNMAALIEDFKNPAIREKLGPSLALITLGHWDRFIKWSAGHGYTITCDDIHEQLVSRPEMVKAFAAHPVLKAWSPESLDRFIVQAKAEKS